MTNLSRYFHGSFRKFSHVRDRAASLTGRRNLRKSEKNRVRLALKRSDQYNNGRKEQDFVSAASEDAVYASGAGAVSPAQRDQNLLDLTGKMGISPEEESG